MFFLSRFFGKIFRWKEKREAQKFFIERIDHLAVVIIDMQEYFLNHHPGRIVRKMIANQQNMLGLCARLDIPVIVLEYAKHGKTVRELKKSLRKVWRKRTIIKRSSDGFQKTALVDHLVKLQIKTLLFMGINASACVLDTAKSALSEGFEIITADDLISDPSDWSMYKSETWYRENGIFVYKSPNLLKSIET